MSEEPKTITVCAIVGPAEHLKRAWREFSGMVDKHYGLSWDSDVYVVLGMIEQSDEYKAMEIAVKNITG